MSLVIDAYLSKLWKAAQAASDAETPSRSFWNQVLSKYIFDGREYAVDTEEQPSSASNEGRIVITVKYFQPQEHFIPILCLVDAKPPNTDATLMHETERQTFDTCAGCLAANKLQHIYAMTTIGTRARLWVYRPGLDYLVPLFGSQDISDGSAYVEANSSDARKLTEAFHRMKSPTNEQNLS